MRPRSTRRPLTLPLALAIAAVSIHADVIVVDAANGAGSDFTDIGIAVNAAREGDTILVRDGLYSWLSIVGKSVTVLADGADVRLQGNLFVGDLAFGQQVLVRGVQASALFVEDCEGAVWFDTVDNLPSKTVYPSTSCFAIAAAGARVSRSERVTFTSCTLGGGTAGGGAGWQPAVPGDGAYLYQSTAQFLDCRLTGGEGTLDIDNTIWGPGVGGAGLKLWDSTATTIGCTITGGGGGVSASAVCTNSKAAGGPGVCFYNASGGVIRSAASTATGGARDLSLLCGSGTYGPAGPAISGAGTIVPLPGFARHLRMNSPVRGGQTLTFEVEGQPGELPILITSLVHEPVPFLGGSLLLQLPPEEIYVLGTLPANGQATLSLPVQDVGLAIGAIPLYAQAAFLDTSSMVWIGGASSTVLVDSSF